MTNKEPLKNPLVIVEYSVIDFQPQPIAAVQTWLHDSAKLMWEFGGWINTEEVEGSPADEPPD